LKGHYTNRQGRKEVPWPDILWNLWNGSQKRKEHQRKVRRSYSRCVYVFGVKFLFAMFALWHSERCDIRAPLERGLCTLIVPSLFGTSYYPLPMYVFSGGWFQKTIAPSAFLSP
jgi:hypothetical protein